MEETWVKFTHFRNKYWKDPVWSKVIATIIITLGFSIFALIYAFAKSLINKVSFISIIIQIANYFKSTIEVYLLVFWISILIFMFILLSFIKSLIIVIKTKNKKESIIEQPKLPDIACESTVLFSRRLSDSFPGQRGINTYYDKVSIDRLQLLLNKPLVFNSIGHGSMSKPIWWFRGNSSLYIESFRKLSKTKILMNVEELIVKKIVVVIKNLYKESYIYVETRGEKQIGLNNYSIEDIERRVSEFGYCKEEFGLYKKSPISRQEYDDASAVINNKVVKTKNAELRVRYISDYNFIIAAKQSPYNSNEFDIFSEPKFNEILAGNLSIESFMEKIDMFLLQNRRKFR